ncbi:membrane protein [Micromonospora avicenniae]|uniref:Membrane protein n=2 Tax=Micromonospora avicenniae TaxID=1198245 RepID=A0A1N6Q3J0_9ACTN|nr:membrane protein [Micromonospora avicenniae]
MSDGPPPSDPSPRVPQPDPGPWAPLDPPPARQPAAPADLWLPTAPAHPPFPAADATSAPTPEVHAGHADPTTGDGRRPDRAAGGRRTRRMVGAILVTALLLGGGVTLGSRLLDHPGDQVEAGPIADDLSQDGGDDGWDEDGGDDGGGEDGQAAEATSAPTPSPATTPSNGPGRISVVYEVTGKGRADILYNDANGMHVWLDRVPLPWKRSIRADRRDQVMLQANKTAGSGDTLRCSVRVDGGAPVTEKIGATGWRASCSG